MSLESTNILHNKLETAATPISSDKGPDFTVGGTPDNQPGKFNNGIRIDDDTENVRITSGNLDSNFNTTEGMIEGWVKNPYNIVDGKQDDDISWHIFFDVLDSGTSERLHIGFSKISGLNWIMRDGGAPVIFISTDSRLDIPADTLTHILFWWDVNDTTKRKVFINGVESASTAVTWSDVSLEDADFWLGTQSGTQFNVNGIIDNVKWGSDASFLNDALNNRENESFPQGSTTIIPMEKTDIAENVEQGGSLYFSEIELTSELFSDIYPFPTDEIYAVLPKLTGDATLQTSNDDIETLKTGGGSWVDWNGSDNINLSETAFRLKRNSGAVGLKMSAKSKQ